jgi:tryptophan-rich sensory protein
VVSLTTSPGLAATQLRVRNHLAIQLCDACCRYLAGCKPPINYEPNGLADFACSSVIVALSWERLFFQSHSLLAAAFALVLATLFTIPLLVLAFRASPVLGFAFLPYQLWLAVATSLAFGFAAQ